MLKSMTGFGRGEWLEDALKVIVEIRSLNHRFREITLRIPRVYLQLEERIKKEAQKRIARGHLDIFVMIEDRGAKKRNVKLDKDLVVDYYNNLKELAETLHIDYHPDVQQFAQYPDVLLVEEQEEDLERIWAAVQNALEEALEQLMLMREQEGARLYGDFLEHKAQIVKILGEIEERIPLTEEEFRIRLKNRVDALMNDYEVDEARMFSEVVLFAERSSVTEEVVRLSSHLGQLSEILESAVPAGRKIEFLIQEMNREINTIGSKASDLVISPLVIEVKSKLEKMREQAQNIE